MFIYRNIREKGLKRQTPLMVARHMTVEEEEMTESFVHKRCDCRVVKRALNQQHKNDIWTLFKFNL